MAIFIGLGSNLGDRNKNLSQAIALLKSRGFEIAAISPVVETPAMLPDDAEPSWNKPFLNCVIQGEAQWSPEQGLKIAKEIEANLGRKNSAKWSPRTIDIDLLVWNDIILKSTELTIPHCGFAQRQFVLTPLLHLKPDLVVPGQKYSIFELSKSVRPVPLWMGILNITPDSFSDGDSWSDEGVLSQHIDSMLAEHVQIIDIGAESTRPNAKPVEPDQEWQRIKPVLDSINARLQDQILRPMISLDSRNPATIEKSLDYGVDIINDVSGLNDPEILSLVKDAECQVVAMHSMSIPADPKITMPDDESAVLQMMNWINQKIESWVNAGLDLNRIIIDPGIGFGKNPLQSIALLQHCNELRQSGLRLLIGHSRKSFMSGFTDQPFADRDLETLGISMALCQQGVDIIRVHDPVMHVRAYRGWSHTMV